MGEREKRTDRETVKQVVSQETAKPIIGTLTRKLCILSWMGTVGGKPVTGKEFKAKRSQSRKCKAD